MNGTNYTRRAVVFAAAGAAALFAESAAHAGSLPQKAVSYQTEPKDGHKCGDCTFFQAPNACKSVAGEISPEGWCKLFHAKAA